MTTIICLFYFYVFPIMRIKGTLSYCAWERCVDRCTWHRSKINDEEGYRINFKISLWDLVHKFTPTLTIDMWPGEGKTYGIWLPTFRSKSMFDSKKKCVEFLPIGYFSYGSVWFKGLNPSKFICVASYITIM
jgi:hypothetical protein